MSHGGGGSVLGQKCHMGWGVSTRTEVSLGGGGVSTRTGEVLHVMQNWEGDRQ